MSFLERWQELAGRRLQPLTNTMYFPMQNTCARVLSTMEGGLAIYRLAARFQLTPGTDDLGTVRAISAETGETT